MKRYNSYLEVDCGRLCKNIQTIQSDLGTGVSLIPVLKSNAYGMGALDTAREIMQAGDIRAFAVAQLGEAAALREAGVNREIIIMAGIPQAYIAPALEQDIQLTVYSAALARAVGEETRRQGKRAGIQIKIETGLNRLGVRPGEELAELLGAVKEQGSLDVKGVYSHFVDSENYFSPLAVKQFARYGQALEQIEAAGVDVPLRHMCNSAATEWYREAFLDGARIGRRLYMDSQLHPKTEEEPGAIREVASWRAQIVSLRLVQAGETVGYDEAFKASGPTMVATVCVGYGDGLDERLSGSTAPVLVTAQGKEARYLSICMDQSLLDVSGIGCKVGDEVTFLGRTSDGVPLSGQAVGAAIGFSGVYLTSKLSPRVQRVYINRSA